jgi:hypothetical protein
VSPARRRALLVLLHGVRSDRPVTESNKTTESERLDDDRLTVYWQSRAGLEREGLVSRRYRDGRHHLDLTPEGYRLALDLAEASS